MRKTLAIVTIGQAPRNDLAFDISKLLNEGINVVEAGLLDSLSREQISSYAPDSGEYPLVTRMNDGSQIKIGRDKIAPLLQRKVDEFANTEIGAVIPMCSCEFPEIRAKIGFLLQPSKILFHTVSSFAMSKRLAVIMPTLEQNIAARKKWSVISDKVFVLAASPYISPETSLINAAQKIKAWGADLCILDCAGFSSWMKELLRERTGIATLSALSVTMNASVELV